MLSDPKQKGTTKEGKVRAESGGSLREAEAEGKTIQRFCWGFGGVGGGGGA